MLACNRLLSIAGALAYGLVAMPIMGCRGQDSAGPAAAGTGVVKLLYETAGGQLEVFDNSDTFSQIVDMNSKGHVIGVREVLESNGAVLSQAHFWSDGARSLDMPVLEGYSSTEAMAISDSGLVVGMASRRIGHPEGSLTAVAWDPKSNKLMNLGHADGDRSSHAQDVSADGKHVVGYSTGNQPPRFRPCLWSLQEDGAWKATTLETLFDNNLYIITGRVLISPDAKRIATCITHKMLPGDVIENAIFGWTQQGKDWKRTLISEDAGRLRGLNNAGQMALTMTERSGATPYRIDWDGTLSKIELLPDDVAGEALSINASGTIAGLSDDPPGPVGGPAGFVWSSSEAGKATTRPLEHPRQSAYSAAYAINDDGGLAGLVDVVVTPDGKVQLISADELERLESQAESLEPDDAPTFKTLGFRWMPKQSR